MKILTALIIITASFSTPISIGAETPKDIVAHFCMLDFEGNRLSSTASQKITPLIMYPSEPGWDLVIGVRKYEIINETVTGDTAKVQVRYEIDRSWPEEIQDVQQYYSETFDLKLVGGVWKISAFIIYPRVSVDLLCSEYNYCPGK